MIELGTGFEHSKGLILTLIYQVNRDLKVNKFSIFLLFILLSASIANFAATTWTGNTSTDWGDQTNWSGTAPSSSTSNVDMIIPSSPSGGRYPILSSGTYSIKKLTVKAGGTLTQNGGFLTLNHNLIIDPGSPPGEYNLTSGTLQMKKNWENEGVFNATGGTVRFSPSANRGAFQSGGNQFFNIEIDDGVQPSFDNADGNNILIAGNFANNNTNFDMTSKATFIFNGSGDQTIYSASTPLPGNTTFGSLVIDKLSGSIQLSSDVAVENTFTELNGTLDVNGNILWVAGSPMPVELSSFSAVILKSGINLKWRTETEVNNYGFEILRQAQNDTWNLLGFVKGHGNSNSPKDYSFIDVNVADGKYSYRLKQIDTDGKFEYSKTIEIDLSSPMNYQMSQNYPNPFNPITTIRFTLLGTNTVILSIYNSLGERVEELINEVKEEGIYTINFNAERLSSGTYFYRLEVDDFTQTKKMILLK